MIGRKTLLIMANTVLGAALGLVALKAIATYFNPELLGQVEFALGMLGLAYFITDLGMASAHTKRVSEGRDPGDCFATFAVFKLSMTLVFVLGTLAVLGTYTWFLGKPLVSTTPLVLMLVLLYYVSKSFQDIGHATFEANMQTARAQVASLTDTVVRVLLTVVGGLVVAAVVEAKGPLRGRLNLDAPAWQWVAEHAGAVLAGATFAGAFAAAIVASYYALRHLERGRFRWDLLRDYWSFALPLFLVTTTIIISTNVDRAMLGFFASAEVTGIFGGLRRVGMMLLGFGSAVGILLFPTFSGMAARGEHSAIHGHMDRSLRYLSILMAPAAAFLIAFAVPVIRIVLDPRWVSGADIFQVLAVYTYVSVMAVPYSMMLFGLNRPGIAANVGLAAALTNIVLNAVLIPDDIQSLGIVLAGLGGLGAALATLASGVVYYSALHVSTKRLSGYRSRASLWKHWLASAVMVGALLALDRLTSFTLVRWYHLLTYVVLGGLLYLAALAALRELRREDVEYVRETVHPGEMLSYLRQELFSRHR